MNSHNQNLYNNLLILSRNICFYKEMNLKDTFETRIYLMFMHFSILLISFKKKKIKFNQKDYDFFFHSIENNLRELGLGDVAVNKKMKDLNKHFYNILLKILDKSDEGTFKMNFKLVSNYFDDFKTQTSNNYRIFTDYFKFFNNFCFELADKNMIKDLIKFKYNYGRT